MNCCHLQQRIFISIQLHKNGLVDVLGWPTPLTAVYTGIPWNLREVKQFSSKIAVSVEMCQPVETCPHRPGPGRSQTTVQY